MASEVPKREQWWWSEKQLLAAGWTLIEVSDRNRHTWWHLWKHPTEMRTVPSEHRTGEGRGAYVHEPPPPQPDEALHEIARRLFPRQSRRCMVHAGSDNPFRVDVRNDFGETVVGTRKPTREQAALALLCAYIEDHNGLHVVEHVHNVDPHGSRFELRFVRVAKVGQPPSDQVCVASTIDGLIDEVVKAVERLARREMTDEEVRTTINRVRAGGPYQDWDGETPTADRVWAAAVATDVFHLITGEREVTIDDVFRTLRRRPR